MFRVLVIDDDLNSRALFSKALQRLGGEVEQVGSTDDGIHKLKLYAFDIIFAGLCVRNIGARGIARWLKEYKPDSRLYIITSWKGELEKQILEADGIKGVIHKPLLFNELRDVVLESKI